MSWSSNNGDDSPWGKNSKDNSKSSYNGSGRKNNNDDFFDNFQNRLKNLFPKKNPASLSPHPIEVSKILFGRFILILKL